MKIMNRVTWEYLKKNKRRTVVTILGVIISVAMITAISTFFGTFLDWMRRDIIDRDGDWQVRYIGVTPKNVPVIENDENTEEAVLERTLGYGQLRPETEDMTASYFHIREYSADGFEFRRLHLEEGRFPETPDELAVSEYAVNADGQKIRIGDELILPVGDRFDRYGEPIDYYGSGWEETFVPAQTKTYRVVGLLNGQNVSSYSGYSYLDISSLSAGDTVSVTVKVTHADAGIYEYAENLGNGIAEAISYNGDLLRTMGIINDSYLSETFLTLTIIVGTIVMIGSIMLIYNAFAISISERGRQLGMLSSVGATRRQKRNSVFFEGAVIGSVAIPLGIIFGILGIGITFYLVDPMIRNVLSITAPLRLKVEPLAIVSAVIFSALTIFISLWIPAKRASRISPIDAIRQSDDIKLKGRRVRTSRLTRKLFGFEGELALKNLKRNNKRYRVTILSLTVSIVLFLTAAAFTHFINKSFEMTTSDIRYDLSVSLYDEEPETVDELIRQVRTLDSVKEAAVSRVLSMQTDLPEQKLTPLAQEHGYAYSYNNAIYNYSVMLRVLDDETLTRYAEQLGVDPQKLRDTSRPAGILQNTITYKDGHHYQPLSFLAEKTDYLPLYLEEYDEQTDDMHRREYSLAIEAMTGEVPITDMTLKEYAGGMTVFISEEVYQEIWANIYSTSDLAASGSWHTAVIASFDNKKAEEEVNALLETAFPERKYMADNIHEALTQQTQLATIVSIFVYGFVALITLISLANIFNTISTSIALRRREFAMLRSVGMTPGSFNRMVRFESVFYGLKALLYGLPLSAVSMFFMYNALSRNFDFVFSLPWKAILGVIAGVFLIVGITMLYSGSKVRRSNIVDTLMDENL